MGIIVDKAKAEDKSIPCTMYEYTENGVKKYLAWKPGVIGQLTDTQEKQFCELGIAKIQPISEEMKARWKRFGWKGGNPDGMTFEPGADGEPHYTIEKITEGDWHWKVYKDSEVYDEGHAPTEEGAAMLVKHHLEDLGKKKSANESPIKVGDIVMTPKGKAKVIGAGRGVVTVFSDDFGEKVFGEFAVSKISETPIKVGDQVKIIGGLMSYHEWSKGKIGIVKEVRMRTGMPPEYVIGVDGNEVWTWYVEKVGSGNVSSERTKLGNKITRGFSPAGWYGRDLASFLKQLGKGWKELYYEAPYHWATINIPERKIFTYTEGDTALIECDTTSKLHEEAKAHIDYLKEMGYSKPVYGEWEGLEKEILGQSGKEVESLVEKYDGWLITYTDGSFERGVSNERANELKAGLEMITERHYAKKSALGQSAEGNPGTQAQYPGEKVWYGINIADLTTVPQIQTVAPFFLPPKEQGYQVARGRNVDDMYVFWELPKEKAEGTDFILKGKSPRIRTETLTRMPKPYKQSGNPESKDAVPGDVRQELLGFAVEELIKKYRAGEITWAEIPNEVIRKEFPHMEDYIALLKKYDFGYAFVSAEISAVYPEIPFNEKTKRLQAVWLSPEKSLPSGNPEEPTMVHTTYAGKIIKVGERFWSDAFGDILRITGIFPKDRRIEVHREKAGISSEFALLDFEEDLERGGIRRFPPKQSSPEQSGQSPSGNPPPSGSKQKCKEKITHIKSAIDELIQAISNYATDKAFDRNLALKHLNNVKSHVFAGESKDQITHSDSIELTDKIEQVIDAVGIETSPKPGTSDMINSIKNKLFDLTLESYVECVVRK